MKSLYIFFAFSLIAQGIVAQPNIEKFSSDKLYDPSDFKLIDHKKAIIVDNTFDYPVYIYNLETGEMLNTISRGNGPSELSDKYKLVTKFEEDEKVMIWDYGLNMAKIYTNELEYVDAVRGDIFKSRLYQVGTLSDSTLFYVDQEEALMHFTVFKNFSAGDKTIYSLNLNNKPEFAPLKNNLLKQGMFFVQQDNSFYIAFEFSSLLLGFGEARLLFSTDEPDKYPFPASGDYEYNLPDIAEYPVCALDVESDEKFLYVLYKGQKASKNQLLKFATNYLPLVERMYHSDTVLVYDRHTGEYVTTITLPVQAMKIEIFRDTIYMLSTMQEDVAGIYFQKLDM